MVTSAYVYGLSRNCNSLIQNAQKCSNDMSVAAYGMSDYWQGLGGEAFNALCTNWKSSMDKLQQNLSSIQSSLNTYADQLQREEEAARQREAEQQREAQRQREAAAAAAAAAAQQKPKKTGK